MRILLVVGLLLCSGCSIVDRPTTMIDENVPHRVMSGQTIKVVVKTEEGKNIEADLLVGNNMWILKEKLK
jgi:hypothetical protein